MNKAVLFLTFNRLEETQKVFEQIKKAQPPRLYISSDGWRTSKKGEKELVKEVRQWVLDNIDWQCEVKTRFLDENLGCGKTISGAITWFFEQEPDGIILEDDCVPSQSFFRFCEELLDKYKDDKRIWHIAGCPDYEDKNSVESYYFTKLSRVWGWATWADRWKYYKFDLSDYDEKNIDRFLLDEKAIEYWQWILEEVKANKVDTWAYRWFFCIVAHQGMSISSSKTLVSNIGYVGVHYEYDSKNCGDINLGKKVEEIYEIIHPNKVEFNKKAIDYSNSTFIIPLPPPPRPKLKYNNAFERMFSVKFLEDRIIITIAGIKLKFKNKDK